MAESQSAALPLGYARQFYFLSIPPPPTRVNLFPRPSLFNGGKTSLSADKKKELTFIINIMR